ncbi:uncharacterized protein Cks30A isoform X1 [Eurosta solidaginis]|uniref:uncharacterized protein Cks30A isoform X1 n=1 Tax=Eurosta solidaginis TaxID=178769 RepID=UPI00353148F2
MRASMQPQVPTGQAEVAQNLRETSNSTPAMMPAQTQSNMRDIVGILPEFEPLKKMLTSNQFVAKVEQLQRMYGWSEETVLFAVQHKIRGIAKDWLDAQPVFQSWASFVSMLTKDFPCTVNAADIHRALAQRKRKVGESLMEYYYVVLAIARRASLDDVSINSYIINGLNDIQLTRALSAMNFNTTNELLRSLENVAIAQPTKVHLQYIAKPAEVTSEGEPKQTNQRGPKCFNCNEMGHIAMKCPRPSKKLRCDKCSKVGHEAKDCKVGVKLSVAEVNTNNNEDKLVPPIVENVQVRGELLKALIDTGSDHSLIKQSTAARVEGKRIPCVRRFEGFGGSLVESTEKIEVELHFSNETLNAQLHLVPSDVLKYDILLGRDVLCNKNNRMVIDAGVLQLQVKKNDLFNVNESFQETKRQEVYNLLCQFSKCFAEDVTALGKCNSTSMKIEVTSDKPIVGKRYQVPLARQEELTQILNKLLENKIIRRSASPHAASVILVSKSNGESRMCVDYRALNAVTIKKQFPMPTVEEQLAKLSGGRYFTTLDMTAGYYQIPLEEDSKKFTAFLTHDGLFEHEVMPFGLVNAPMYFQEMILHLISGLKNRKRIISYVDEVIIATTTVDEGKEVLKEFLEAVPNPTTF